KGANLDENLERNFGMMNPEGYRKALRLAKQAEKFNRPVITFVDTSGAYPGKGAEERGQAAAIAECLMRFSDLKVPVLCIIIGEGGSGGALALSVADRLYMLEHAVYSVLSPEGFASILWKDDSRVEEAAGVMGLTAKDLYDKQIIDEIVQEPIGGVEVCEEYVISQLDQFLTRDLTVLCAKKKNELVMERYKKFRKIGV
ncbi:MAG: carboxyl transferase domain-containing protein, partial [Eubacterium sp.]